MNPEIKKRWVEALRSGRYQQGRGTLRTRDNRFCCLGVLCDLVDPNKWSRKSLSSTFNYLSLENSPTSGYPPDFVRQATGLEMITESELAAMNDTGTPFTKIADYIEDNL